MTSPEQLLKTILSTELPPPGGEVILVFASNTEVLNVEDQLEELELTFELVPVPKEVNPNCGLAISFTLDNEVEILTALKVSNFIPLASYRRQGPDFAPWPLPLLTPLEPLTPLGLVPS